MAIQSHVHPIFVIKMPIIIYKLMIMILSMCFNISENGINDYLISIFYWSGHLLKNPMLASRYLLKIIIIMDWTIG